MAGAKSKNKKSKKATKKPSKTRARDDISILKHLKSAQILQIKVVKLAAQPEDSGVVRVLSKTPTVEELKSIGLRIWPKAMISPMGITFGFTEKRPTWIVHPREDMSLKSDPQIELSTYALYRDLAGDFFRSFEQTDTEAFIEFDSGLADEEIKGFFVGLELAGYRYKQVLIESAQKSPMSKLVVASEASQKIESLVKKSAAIAGSVNLTRQLVNWSGGQLNPESFAKLVEQYFSKQKNLKITVWREAELIKQKCNLILAVGQSAKHKPALVRISYQPDKKTKQSPIGLIGKGVTFDSGGLDIKPSSGMRIMKKDMAGAAAMMGVASWLSENHISKPVEIFMPLAENAISENSMRPGDVITSKSGISVEIHNTDAEGRLVLADAMTVAKEIGCGEIIDVATLTGAIKVALGGDVAGLFANDLALRNQLSQASQLSGEPSWPMPIVQNYRIKMKSTVADMQNAVDGFGGAVTAALFLQSFIGPTPWAHLDIYGWADGPTGALSEGGGSGQMVQTLIHFLSR